MVKEPVSYLRCWFLVPIFLLLWKVLCVDVALSATDSTVTWSDSSTEPGAPHQGLPLQGRERVKHVVVDDAG